MTAEPQPQCALVIGASSGIGAACVTELVRRGYRVAAVARREDRLDSLRDAAPQQVRTYVHDVTEFNTVPARFSEIVDDLGETAFPTDAGAYSEEDNWIKFASDATIEAMRPFIPAKEEPDNA